MYYLTKLFRVWYWDKQRKTEMAQDSHNESSPFVTTIFVWALGEKIIKETCIKKLINQMLSIGLKLLKLGYARHYGSECELN